MRHEREHRRRAIVALNVISVRALARKEDCPRRGRLWEYWTMNRLPKNVFEPGTRFGKLVVEKYLGIFDTAGVHRTCVQCRCDCGTTCIVPASLLKAGRRKSCGCAAPHAKRMATYDKVPDFDLLPPNEKKAAECIGRTFGLLTILAADGYDRYRGMSHFFVKCRCACGKKCRYPLGQILNGRITCCGCMRGKISANDIQIDGVLSALATYAVKYAVTAESADRLLIAQTLEPHMKSIASAALAVMRRDILRALDEHELDADYDRDGVLAKLALTCSRHHETRRRDAQKQKAA